MAATKCTFNTVELSGSVPLPPFADVIFWHTGVPYILTLPTNFVLMEVGTCGGPPHGGGHVVPRKKRIKSFPSNVLVIQYILTETFLPENIILGFQIIREVKEYCRRSRHCSVSFKCAIYFNPKKSAGAVKHEQVLFD